MAKQEVNRTIVNGVDNFTVNILDNGFTVEYTGNNSENDWVTSKTIVSDVDKLCEIIRGIVVIPRSS
jgi:hypothetical protein